MRVFAGRNSTGVWGIKLDKGDRLISMAIMRHVDAAPAERAEYVRQANAIRRAASGEAEVPEEETQPDMEETETAELTPERYAELGAHEQFILTISQNGYGKRSSAYEYRVSGRGGKGIINLKVSEKTGEVIGARQVVPSDGLMLITQSIILDNFLNLAGIPLR